MKTRLKLVKYKSFVGYAEFDKEFQTFYGYVINTRDVITFQGKVYQNQKGSFTIRWMIIWNFVRKEERRRITMRKSINKNILMGDQLGGSFLLQVISEK